LHSWDDSDNLQTPEPDDEDSAARVAAELLDLDVSDLELAESDPYLASGSLPDQPAAAGESLPSMDGLDAWDDMATKIDLAKAYLELDDSEEARGLLAAVIEDGTEQQREEAQQILSKIA
jgi:pilus assembly protein FimV